MKRFVPQCLILILAFLLPAQADELILKNGKIIKGDITTQTDTSVSIKTKRGLTLSFDISEIDKIIKSPVAEKKPDVANEPPSPQQPDSTSFDEIDDLNKLWAAYVKEKNKLYGLDQDTRNTMSKKLKAAYDKRKKELEKIVSQQRILNNHITTYERCQKVEIEAWDAPQQQVMDFAEGEKTLGYKIERSKGQFEYTRQPPESDENIVSCWKYKSGNSTYVGSTIIIWYGSKSDRHWIRMYYRNKKWVKFDPRYSTAMKLHRDLNQLADKLVEPPVNHYSSAKPPKELETHIETARQHGWNEKNAELIRALAHKKSKEHALLLGMDYEARAKFMGTRDPQAAIAILNQRLEDIGQLLDNIKSSK